MNLKFLRGEFADRDWKEAAAAADSIPNADRLANLEIEFVTSKRGTKERRVQLVATDDRGARFNSGLSENTEAGYTKALRGLSRFAAGVARK